MSFSPQENPTLRSSMQITAYLLIATCVLGVILLFFQQPKLQLITLLLASFITAFFALRISQLS
jgi:ABC-type polysaccharide/polyol phosphate export permease